MARKAASFNGVEERVSTSANACSNGLGANGAPLLPSPASNTV